MAAPFPLRRLHALLAVQSIVVILLSINRLSPLTLGYVAPNEFLRWVDLNNMLVLPLVSLVAFYLLKRLLEQAAPGARGSRGELLLSVAFLLGAYGLGASYGDHEVTNYLHTRFCTPDDGSALCRIVIFNDDQFSHWLFFTAFLLINGSMMLLQLIYPIRTPLSPTDRALLLFNGLFIAAGIFANLAFERIGLDLYVVAALAGLAFWLLWRVGRQPLFLYYSSAYGVGLLATALVIALR